MLSEDRFQDVFVAFYNTPRAGVELLSDGGGPFGFDIHAALIFDSLIDRFAIDGIIESGTCVGDTTDYLSRLYSDLQVVSFELDHRLASFAETRLKDRKNVHVRHGDSASLLASTASSFDRPLIYLDAHWADEWPLEGELESLKTAVIVIDDYDIGHERFSFDCYDGVACDRQLLDRVLPTSRVFVPDVSYAHRFPCLQVGRRSGQAFLTIGLSDDRLESHPALRLQPFPIVTPAC